MTISKQAAKWRESASLIILAKEALKSKSDADYKVLLFSRSEKASFMPASSVFPGGVIETADESLSWFNYFQSFGIKQDELKALIFSKRPKTKPQPKIFQTEEGRSPLHRDISLRISALRETFEETGIMLCRNRKTFTKLFTNKFAGINENFDRKHWQHLVHNDPDKFLKLCQQLDVVPDIWSLNEWSVWLTPAMRKKRFETAFYLVSLPCQPHVLLEETEGVDYKWVSPKEALLLNLKGDIWLPPPQFFELSRLLNYEDLGDLQNFAIERARKGTILMMPVMRKCSDGMVRLFPGDSHYPNDPNSATELNDMKMSMSDFRNTAEKLHRFEFTKLNEGVLYLNFEPVDGHKKPINVKPLANL